MKNKGRIISIIAGIIIVIIAVYIVMEQREYVARGDEIEEYPTQWNNIIASSTNANVLVVNIDGNRYNSDDIAMYMSDDMQLMCTVKIIGEMFNCAAKVHSDNTIKITRGDVVLQISPIDSVITKNGVLSDDIIPVEVNTKGLFISLQALSEMFEYSYVWDAATNQMNIVNTNQDNTVLPSYYNYEEEERINGVKNQGNFGTCWAFAALSAVESTLLPEEVCDFSEDHLTMNNSYNLTSNQGGDYQMAVAYFTAWQGPVFEEDDPYGDGITNSDIPPVKHVQEVQIIPAKDYKEIKMTILKYGGVQSSLYAANTNSRLVESAYYNKATNSYCYDGDEIPNHDIVIIGWDDNYDKNNFNSEVEGDGAFICRNSWGESFGTNGDFYVSYYDSNIGNYNVAYTKVEDKDNYDNIYQSDLCGWVGQVGYGKEEAYFSNVYKSEGEEELKAVGFYSTGPNTEYSIYFCEKYDGTTALSRRGDPVVTGTLKNAGYYTVNIDKTIHLNKGQEYAIIVKIKTPGSERPVAVEFKNDYATETVDISDGRGYISLKGIEWENTENKHMCNVCLKTYTNDAEE